MVEKSNVPEVKLTDLVDRFHAKQKEVMKVNIAIFMQVPNQPPPAHNIEDDVSDGSNFVLIPPVPFMSAQKMADDVDRASTLMKAQLEGIEQELCYRFAQEAVVSRVAMSKRDMAEIAELDPVPMRRWVRYFKKQMKTCESETLPGQMVRLVKRHAELKKRTTWNQVIGFVTRTTGQPIGLVRQLIPRK